MMRVTLAVGCLALVYTMSHAESPGVMRGDEVLSIAEPVKTVIIVDPTLNEDSHTDLFKESYLKSGIYNGRISRKYLLAPDQVSLSDETFDELKTILDAKGITVSMLTIRKRVQPRPAYGEITSYDQVLSEITVLEDYVGHDPTRLEKLLARSSSSGALMICSYYSEDDSMGEVVARYIATLGRHAATSEFIIVVDDTEVLPTSIQVPISEVKSHPNILSDPEKLCVYISLSRF